MPDPTVMPSEWFWRALVGAGSAVMATGTTIFATRKNNEASVLKAVNERIDAQFARQDAEIEHLRRALKTDREECDEQLQLLRDEIARLMANPLNAAIPAYTEDDVAKGQLNVRAAQRRQARKRP